MENNNDRINSIIARPENVEVYSVENATVGQLAKGLVKLIPGINDHYKALARSDDKPAVMASAPLLMKLIAAKTAGGTYTSNVKDVLPLMSNNHTIVVEKNKPVTVLDSANVPVPVVEYGGHVVPETYPDAQVRCVMTTLADAAYFPINSKRMLNRTEIDNETANMIRFPYVPVNPETVPKSDATRAEFMARTIDRMVEDSDYALSILKTRIPKHIKFSFDKGLFVFNYPGTYQITDLAQMYRLVDLHRKIRGSDKSPRHLELASYMYGVGSRAMYKEMYVLHDILELGYALGVNMLEITTVDKHVSLHVLASLVYAGWVIRVAGTNMYPTRAKDEKTGKFVLDKGVFRFFETSDRYLRYVPIDDAGPTVHGDVVSMPEHVGEDIMREFDKYPSASAIPFARIFLHPDMAYMKTAFPGCSLYPSMHAHNGHVLIARAEFVRADSAFSLLSYMNRVAYATSYKTFYIYTRRPFWNVDPYGAVTKMALKGREAKKENTATFKWVWQDVADVSLDPRLKDVVFSTTPEVPIKFYRKLNVHEEKGQKLVKEGRRLIHKKKELDKVIAAKAVDFQQHVELNVDQEAIRHAAEELDVLQAQAKEMGKRVKDKRKALKDLDAMVEQEDTSLSTYVAAPLAQPAVLTPQFENQDLTSTMFKAPEVKENPYKLEGDSDEESVSGSDSEETPVKLI